MATPITLVEQVRELFEANNWSVADETMSVFDGFCRVLVAATEEERTMLLDLSRDFSWIPLPQIGPLIRPAVAAAIGGMGPKSRIFLVPLLKQKDYQKIKSCHAIAYYVGGMMFRDLLPAGTEGIDVDRPDNLQQYNISPDDGIIAVDDFIGTGKTCRTAIREIAFHAKSAASTRVAVMFAMQDAFASLTAEGITIHASQLRPKGITNNPRLRDDIRTLYTRIMTQIEDRLNIGNDYRFGFQRSEALLSFDRVPNNTFPVYWAETEKPDKRRGPPFLRV